MTFYDSLSLSDSRVSMSSRPTTGRPWTGKERSTSQKTSSWAAQSRPTTARPQTAVSTRHEGSYIVAVFEGRGVSREVGIAAMDHETGQVILVQVRIWLQCAYMLFSFANVRLPIAKPTSSLCIKCICIVQIWSSFPIHFYRHRMVHSPLLVNGLRTPPSCWNISKMNSRTSRLTLSVVDIGMILEVELIFIDGALLMVMLRTRVCGAVVC